MVLGVNSKIPKGRSRNPYHAPSVPVPPIRTRTEVGPGLHSVTASSGNRSSTHISSDPFEMLSLVILHVASTNVTRLHRRSAKRFPATKDTTARTSMATRNAAQSSRQEPLQMHSTRRGSMRREHGLQLRVLWMQRLMLPMPCKLHRILGMTLGDGPRGWLLGMALGMCTSL